MKSKSDILLREALMQARIEKYRSIPDEEIQWNPSERFEKNMEKLIRKQKRITWKYTNTFSKRLVAAMLISCLLFGGAMSVQAIRDPFIHFITNITETFTRFFSESKEDYSMQYIRDEYTISNLPEGYELKFYDNTGHSINHTWVDDKNNTIGFIQSLYGSEINLNTEGVELTDIEINGKQGYLCSNEGQQMVVWSDIAYEYLITCPQSIDYKILIQNIEKIKE